MMLIGLAGSAGTGKDTIADYLVEQYGFTKFSFSDALYREVCSAFGVNDDELRDRELKERPHPRLTARTCADKDFSDIMLGCELGLDEAVSPRWVLQHWGTEYRRAQNPNYWLERATLWVEAWLQVTKDDGEYHGGLVNTSVRFPNEQSWVDALDGVVWHVRRPDCGECCSGMDHVAEQQLPVGENDREVWNTGTVEQLHTAVSLALQAPFEKDPNLVVDESKLGCCDSHETTPQLLMCTSCHRLHKAYTQEQAAAEVSLVNSSLGLDADGKPQTMVTADEYHGCVWCGAATLVPIDQIDIDTVAPVIFEVSNNVQ